MRGPKPKYAIELTELTEACTKPAPRRPGMDNLPQFVYALAHAHPMLGARDLGPDGGKLPGNVRRPQHAGHVPTIRQVMADDGLHRLATITPATVNDDVVRRSHDGREDQATAVTEGHEEGRGLDLLREPLQQRNNPQHETISRLVFFESNLGCQKKVTGILVPRGVHLHSRPRK